MATFRPSVLLVGAFGLALAILVFVGVVSYRTTVRLVEQSRNVQHTLILLEEFRPQLPPDAQRYLERVRTGTQQMGQLVDDLLNLTRLGRRELTLQVSGLNSIVREVLSDLKPETADRQIDWKIGNLPFVECDPALMKQVFSNLLSNAVKFTRFRGAR